MADIMPPPSIADQTNPLESLDPSVPCTYADHEAVGSGPAVWIVWKRPGAFCECAKRAPYALLCDGCWTYLVGVGKVRCETCGGIYDVLRAVDRMERL